MTVNFWNFSKKANSTARPAGNPASVFDVKLKDTSGILNPVLEIFNTVGWNPSALCYAQIPNFGRYYNVQDWQWIGGRWECTLVVDPLASWKTEIGNSSHYITRSSYTYNKNIVDDYYPALASKPEFITNTTTFDFEPFNYGTFVVGIAGTGSRTGVNYYLLHNLYMSTFMAYLFPEFADWTQSFTALTDSIYRSIYGPFDYIKSCMWFPFDVFDILPSPTPSTEWMKFGNYIAEPQTAGDPSAVGWLLDGDNRNWPIFRRTLSLPAGWQLMDAKYKTNPYGALHVVFNPFGVIELNPTDFSNATGVMLELWPDFVSGDGLLKIYKVTNEGQFFITETTSKISVNIPISASMANFMGVISGGATAVGSAIAALSASSGVGMFASALAASSGVNTAVSSAIPTMSNSVGSLFGGPRAMDGVAMLIFSSTNFVPEDNADHGKPLMDTRTINTIPGYIKCAEGHISIPAYTQEVEMINEYLKGGFYYE